MLDLQPNPNYLDFEYRFHGRTPRQTDHLKFAISLFDKGFIKGSLRRWLAKLAGKSLDLMDIQQVLGACSTQNCFDRGGITVKIDDIVGSYGRCSDFDRSFYPLRENMRQRWVNIAVLFLSGIFVPAVSLMEIRGAYYIIDGHHRISTAKMLGYRFIDAEVKVWNFGERVIPLDQSAIQIQSKQEVPVI